MTPAPNRRWFQWSLRTLFVVMTLASVSVAWVAYHLNWMMQRRQVLENGTVLVPMFCDFGLGDASGHTSRTPWGLWILGEKKASSEFSLPASTPDEEVERIVRLFPEVDVRRLYPVSHAQLRHWPLEDP